jgi:hypothetical protein
LTIPVDGRLFIPVTGLLTIPVDGRLFIPVTGLLTIPVDGRLFIPVTGLLTIPVDGRLFVPVLVVGRMPVFVIGRMPVLVAGRTPVFVIGRAPVLLAGRTFVIGLAVFAAGRAADFAGAGLEGGGAEVFFWSPQTSAEVSISIKSTISFLGIPLSCMFNLQMTALVYGSLIADFIGRSKRELHNPPTLYRKRRSAHFCACGCALWSETFS